MTTINLNAKRILDALSKVKCGQDVFEALQEVPHENLIDMKNMIDYILKHYKREAENE